jgi:hypothetical protein
MNYGVTYSLELTMDDKYVIALGQQYRFLRRSDKELISRLNGMKFIHAVSVSPDGECIVLFNAMGQVLIFRYSDDKMHLISKEKIAHTFMHGVFHKTKNILFSHDERILSSTDLGITSHKKLLEVDESSRILSLSSVDDSVFVFVRKYNREKHEPSWQLECIDILTNETVSVSLPAFRDRHELRGGKFINENKILLVYYRIDEDISTIFVSGRLHDGQFISDSEALVDCASLLMENYRFSPSGKYIVVSDSTSQLRDRYPLYHSPYRVVVFDTTNFSMLYDTIIDGSAVPHASFSCSGNYLLLPGKKSTILPVSTFAK